MISELNQLINDYAKNKKSLDVLDKECKEQNKKIKSIMYESDLDSYETDTVSVTFNIQERHSMNEEGLIEYLKKNIDKEELDSLNLIKTKEVINEDALENAIYNFNIPKEIILGMEQYDTVKEVQVLKIKELKKKGGK